MKKYLLIILLASSFSVVMAQPMVKSGYFLNGMMNRHRINPAIINSAGYVGIPFLSDISIGVQTNIGVSKFLFPMQGGGLTTFMSGEVSADEFLSGLSSKNSLNLDVSYAIADFGFHSGGAYHTGGINLRSYVSGVLPYELFNFMKSGMSSVGVSDYMIKDINVSSSNFMDFSYGYARPINENITIGGKLKLLIGLADVKAHISEMHVSMSQNEWLVRSQGSLTAGTIGDLDFKSDDKGVVNGVGFRGFSLDNIGVGLDLGITYQTPVEGLKLSLAVVDLGFISWSNVARAHTDGKEFRFSGFSDISVGGGSGKPVNEQLEDLKNQAMNLFKFYPEAQRTSNVTSLRTTLNVGVEYELVPETFSFGLLSSTRFSRDFILSELIVSANYKPKSWFNAAVTADISNVAISWGTIINFCPRFINFFVGVDFMMTAITPQFLPMRDAGPRFSLGLSAPINAKKYYRR